LLSLPGKLSDRLRGVGLQKQFTTLANQKIQTSKTLSFRAQDLGDGGAEGTRHIGAYFHFDWTAYVFDLHVFARLNV
jgi:hypothetical protein